MQAVFHALLLYNFLKRDVALQRGSLPSAHPVGGRVFGQDQGQMVRPFSLG